jgi:hypothetical protein
MMSIEHPLLLVKVVVCLVPWFLPIAVAWQWKASTKMTVWSGVMAKPSMSALLSSSVHHCSKMADPIFVK